MDLAPGLKFTSNSKSFKHPTCTCNFGLNESGNSRHNCLQAFCNEPTGDSVISCLTTSFLGHYVCHMKCSVRSVCPSSTMACLLSRFSWDTLVTTTFRFTPPALPSNSAVASNWPSTCNGLSTTTLYWASTGWSQVPNLNPGLFTAQSIVSSTVSFEIDLVPLKLNLVVEWRYQSPHRLHCIQLSQGPDSCVCFLLDVQTDCKYAFLL